eukprot:GFUD01009449.1.p1 GENE.GFUD01009449.1~~GFUD01009449.1.p1  ORF type:complete len:958 (+),score=187.13 GFUD01009449.1:48-2921(+)
MSTELDNELLSICQSGPVEKAQQLVAAGANQNCSDANGVTPLMRALEFNITDIVSWLVPMETVDVERQSKPKKETALHYACRYGCDGETVARLANRMDSAVVNLKNDWEKTAVFRAVEWNNTSALQGLLSVKTVDWEVRDGKGRSLLTIAREKGNEELINLLNLNTDNCEAVVKKKGKELKDDQNSYVIKLNIDDKQNAKELFYNLPKHLGELTKIKKAYSKNTEDGKGLEAGIEGVGKDTSMHIAEYVLLQTSVVKRENGNNITSNSYEIYFKILGDMHENTVEFFKQSVCKCFAKEEKPMSTLLRSAQMKEDKEATNLLVLPLQMSSLTYLFNYSKIDHSTIVGMLEEAETTWLSLLFNQYAFQDQVYLFGDAKVKQGRIPLHLVRSEKNGTLLEHIAKGGDIMKRHQDELISMLKRIDTHENADKDDGANRIISKLKEGLESSAHLSDLIDIVNSKFVMPIMKMACMIFISFCINIVVGIGFFVGDFGTDGYFTDNMRTLHGQSLSNENLNENCTNQFQKHFTDLDKTCKLLSKDNNSSSTCMKDLKNIIVEGENCFFEEVNRFADPEDWDMMFKISLSHTIVPMIMYTICGCILARSRRPKWKIWGTFPLVAKLRMFYLETKLYLSKSEKKQNDKDINDIREEIYEYQETVALALLIEASSESSFQFYFQTLYRMPIVYEGYEAMQNHLLSNLFNWRNVSILVSFFTMSYSYYTIRNLSKKRALKPVHFGLILSRTICDTVGRISLVFAWLHVFDVDGNFQPFLATCIYYGTFLVLVIFNIVFNTSKFECSAEYVLGVILNSLSSILSYNFYDYSSLLGRKEGMKGHVNHQQSFVRQCLYTALVTTLYISLTVWAVRLIQEKNSVIYIIDTMGNKQKVTPMFFYGLIITSWISHGSACLFNLCYYGSHPTNVILKEKKTEIWCLGFKRDIGWLFHSSEPLCPGEVESHVVSSV